MATRKRTTDPVSTTPSVADLLAIKSASLVTTDQLETASPAVLAARAAVRRYDALGGDFRAKSLIARDAALKALELPPLWKVRDGELTTGWKVVDAALDWLQGGEHPGAGRIRALIALVAFVEMAGKVPGRGEISGL